MHKHICSTCVGRISDGEVLDFLASNQKCLFYKLFNMHILYVFKHHKMIFWHAVTRPLKNVRKRRFRKTLKKKVC